MNNSRVQFFHGENQIPILAPDNIAVFNGKSVELTFIQIFVILRVRMSANIVADINCTHSIVAKPKVNRQVACVCGICDK